MRKNDTGLGRDDHRTRRPDHHHDHYHDQQDHHDHVTDHVTEHDTEHDTEQDTDDTDDTDLDLRGSGARGRNHDEVQRVHTTA